LGQQLLKAGAPLLAAAIGDATPTALSGDQLSLAVPPARIAVLSDPAQQRVVAAAGIAVFGVRFRLLVTLKAGAGEATTTGVTDARQRRYLAAQEHPVVKELMQRFEADLVGRELVDFATWLERLTADREGERKRRFAGELRDEDGRDG
jgi:hypothetical protein